MAPVPYFDLRVLVRFEPLSLCPPLAGRAATFGFPPAPWLITPFFYLPHQQHIVLVLRYRVRSEPPSREVRHSIRTPCGSKIDWIPFSIDHHAPLDVNINAVISEAISPLIITGSCGASGASTTVELFQQGGGSRKDCRTYPEIYLESPPASRDSLRIQTHDQLFILLW